MCLDELNDICKQIDLYNENFVEREMNFAFNLSMMTQVDEINQTRFQEMNNVEFYEALARIAQECSL